MKKEYESPELEVVKLNFDAMMTNELIDKSAGESGGSTGDDGNGDDPFA